MGELIQAIGMLLVLVCAIIIMASDLEKGSSYE